MAVKCRICENNFEDSPDNIILCRHHEGPVHFGCCINNCSKDYKPCMHAIAEYEKKSGFDVVW